MISYKISRNEVISAHSRALYLCLRSYGPLCYPSYKVIMKQTGLKSRTTVLKAIRDLKIMGFLEVYKTGIRKPQYYFFPLENDYWDRKEAFYKNSKRTRRVPKLVHQMDINKNNSIISNEEDQNSYDPSKIQETLSSILNNFTIENTKNPE